MLMYRKMNRMLNAVIVCCLFGFIVIFLKTPNEKKHIADGVPVVEDSGGWSTEEWQKMINEISVEETDLGGWKFQPKSGESSVTGEQIIESVNFLNENFDILNIQKFGSLDNVKKILVIQVHNRPNYLQYLIESMKATKGIEDALLVFSHDINVASINEMIRNITFARVYQIFYPYNMQLFPSVFPGQSINDCPEKITKLRAKNLNCTNWKSPDKYGHYRVAKITQIKHHWWWKMNFVFDGIVDKFKMNDPWVLLLEEDHMLAPDALHVLDILVDNKPKLCATCEIITLGMYLQSTENYGVNIANLGIHPWYSSRHNMGMAIQKDTWQTVKTCSHMFCNWDDYNWDWSLMQISAKCLPKKFRVLFTKSPRVIHIGDCGVHTHRCEAHRALESTKELFANHRNLLFPEKMSVTDISRKSLKPSKENGGWGDIRDRELCELNKSPLKKIESSKNTVLSEMLAKKFT